jgi:endonuclease YncB( thermonuclease family)
MSILAIRHAALLAVLVFCAPLLAWPADRLEQSGSGVAAEIVDGDTLFLDNGTEVRLVGLQAPKLALGRKGFEPWPLADESKAQLEELTLGKHLSLSYGGRRVDRYGRALAHLHGDDGLWIQGEMLRLGMARVYTFRDNTALAGQMLELERQARAAGRGIWSHPFYAVRRHDRLKKDIGSFQLVEGRVRRVAQVRGNTYLNFGEDWRTDFTVFVDSRDRRRMEKAGHDLHALEGQVIRVRGWVKSYNGPSIRVDHWEQIEVFQ